MSAKNLRVFTSAHVAFMVVVATVVVSGHEVSKPVAVRHAFQNNPAGCNLYNGEGLPASPFRTDNW